MAFTISASPATPNPGKLQPAYPAFRGSCNQLRSLMADDYAEKAGALLRQALDGQQRALTDAEIDAARMERAIRDLEHEHTEALRQRAA